MHPEDLKIVEYARDLCRQLNMIELDPRTVSWVNRMLTTQIIIFQANIRLPRQLMGQLRVDEWRPLLASSIIYYGKFRAWPMSEGFLLPMFTGVLVLSAILFVILRMSSSPFYPGLMWAAIGGWTVFSLFMMRRFFGTMKKLLFAADAKAAELVGRESFIEVLSKIHALKLDYQPRFVGRLNFSPTTRQRLDNLRDIIPVSGPG